MEMAFTNELRCICTYRHQGGIGLGIPVANIDFLACVVMHIDEIDRKSVV